MAPPAGERDSMDRALRLLSLLRDLPRGRGSPGSTAAALATRFSTSERSIYRDMAVLQEAGFPVHNDREGYYLLPTDSCVPARLTSDELASLIFASQWVEKAVPQALLSDYSAAVDKLTSLCGTAEAAVHGLDPDTGIAVNPTVTDGPSACVNLATAVRARRAQRKLRAVYSSPENVDEIERVLHPYAITYRGHAHYLVAYCEWRREVRTFRLDRFLELEVLDATAEIPDHVDLEQHFSGAWQVTGGRRRKVRILMRGQVARSYRHSLLHASQEILRSTPDELELQFSVALTGEFRSWILSLGPEVEVLAPASLAKEIADTAEKISEIYRTT